MKLTPKERAFAEAYVETGNASEAYRRAYNVGENTKLSTIKSKASNLLKKDNISITVSNLQKELAKKNEITRQDLVDMYLSIIETHEAVRDKFKGGKLSTTDLKKIYAMSNSGYIKGSDVASAISGIAKLMGFDKPDPKDTPQIVQNIQINIKHNRD